MSTTTPTTSAPLPASASNMGWQSRIYHAVMTPINFVTFILSLYLIDNHYRAQRHRQRPNSETSDSGRPWLHWLLFRQRSSPYDLVGGNRERTLLQSTNTTLRHDIRVRDEDNAHIAPVKEAGNSWYYHTKQKKLFKVEVTEAFALRNPVLCALCILFIFISWVLWQTLVCLAIWGRTWVVFTSHSHTDDP
ncbi:hypothetical protein F4825DRAFT_435934 [Nemania diffusa]|nr:hypothetical protein F4825DRAFT_435934 [Nemania diffusa]